MIAKKINFHLFICGSGPEEQSFREEMYSISSTARRHITFVGNVSPDNMSKVWKSADICLITSDFEGTSITMLEAMALGCVPIVELIETYC
jgi:glycosyltransferase involved in cell wall biosynthesis